ncbi:MAG: PAS domain-containing sensor histidine kinase [Thermodesulfovibrionales bacterium]
MDITLIIIGLSLALQLIAAVFAAKLLLLPGRRLAGLITVTIILLMAVRRIISFYGLAAGKMPQGDLFAETIALCVSLLLLIGILYLNRLVRSEREMAAMLRDSKQHYQTLFNQSPDGVLLIDLSGQVLDFNDTAARDLGYTREEFSRLHLSDIDPVETPEEIQKRIADILREGHAEFEVKHKTKGGDVRDVHVITQVSESAGKKVFHTIWRDITERKLSEKTLKESESFLQTIIETEPECIKLLDSTGGLMMMNRAGLAMIDADSLAQVKGQCVYPLVAPGYREAFQSLTEDVFRGKSGVLEFEAIGIKGRHVWLETHAVPLRNDKTDIVALLGVTRDITESKRSENALIENRAMLKQILDTIPQAIFWKDRESVYLGCNAVFAQAAGLEDSGQVKGKTDFELPWPKTEAEIYRRDDREVITSRVAKKHIIEPLQQADGSRLWIDTTKVPLIDQHGNAYGVLGVYEDITERKNAEERLRKSEGRLRLSQEVARLGSWDLDLLAQTLEWSDETYTLFDKTPGEFVPSFDAFARTVHNDDRETMQTNFNNALKSDAMPYHVAVRIINDSGREWVMEAFGAVRRNEDGSPIGIFGTAQDITAQKKAEEALRQKEEMMRDLLDGVDEGFIVVDRDYRILSVNRAYCSQVAQNPTEILGRHCYEVSHRLSRPCFENGEGCATRRVFETGEPHVSIHRHPAQGNDLIYVETKAFPLKDSSGKVTSVIEVINNITEKQLLEEQRLKTQKLEAVGTLAGGIAHDFNNLLQGVFGYITMAKMNLDQRQKSLDMLEQAEKALHMSVNLTTQLLTFSKGGKPLRKRMQLGPVIVNSVKFALSGSKVDYRIQVDEALWMVDADGGQIGQVIQNIVLNAEQAMPAGGTVTISAKNESAPQKGLPPALTPGNYVCISIDDTGIGIAEESLTKIFDPYFTTKDKGSGLGLATSYSIIRNHGGMIDVKSEPGKGSTFSLWLPATENEEMKAETFSASAPVTRKCHVLLMDDEQLVRNIAGEMIKTLGHEVTFAENGEEAIAGYRASLLSGRKFDIVILDLTIRGGMGGEEVIKALLEIDPDIKAVVSSGYADSSAISEFQAQGFKACLAKPYSVSALRDTLNSLM